MSGLTSNSTSVDLSMLTCSLYGVLFCIGVPGNVWVIGVVLYVLKTFHGLAHNSNIILYILALSIVDLMVLLNLPMLICDILMDRWIFGDFLCKTFWVIESVNKLMSEYLLTAVSLDRFLTICKPHSRYFIRSANGTCTVIAVMTVTVFCAMFPIYVFAQEVKFGFNEVTSLEEIYTDHKDKNMYQTVEYKHDSNDTLLGDSKCVLNFDSDMSTVFTIYIFAIGFCIPTTLIIYFNSQIILTLSKHVWSVQNAQSHIPLRRITSATFVLIVFFLFCWTPFWTTTIYDTLDPHRMMEKTEVYVMYFVHFLVYVNSAANWILYAFLNRNLKEARELACRKSAEVKARLLNLENVYMERRWTFSAFAKGETSVMKSTL